MRIIPLVLIALLIGCTASEVDRRPITLDELRIDISTGSREIGYTNKQAGVYYTESNEEQTSGWQGWHIFSQKILDDYRIQIDGENLNRSEVVLTEVFPHQFTRIYGTGLRETVTLLDSVNALIVELDYLRGRTLTVWPMFRGVHTIEDFDIDRVNQVLLLRRSDRPDEGGSNGVPSWLALVCLQRGTAVGERTGEQRGVSLFSPAGLSIDASAESTVLLFVAGHNKDEALELSLSLTRLYTNSIEQRKARMEQLLNRAYIRTDDSDLDRALHWALLSMDALVMNQGKKGIFAGLPWFSNYWGRDSFIALPGATLVTGQFLEAKSILQSFAEWQDGDERSASYGRIPNLVTPNSTVYNTTDGTPWFIIALADYVMCTADTLFARQTFPVVTRSIEAVLARHSDSHRFMTHGDAETWMDAVGPNGPWSPRGDRANDIQALWYRQLIASANLADLVGHSDLSAQWRSIAADLKRNFNRLFVDTAMVMIFDHLNSDDSPDSQYRPNQLFALDLLSFGPEFRRSLFQELTRRLVYPYGVASLWQEDENFHPFHHYAPYYVPDAAYHNGIVWTWLAGPWIDEATDLGYPDIAFVVTRDLTQQILNRGAAGTLSELLDAHPRPGEKTPRPSGTFTQAWSLAEYLRTMYRDYCGVSVNLPEKTIRLRPRLPSDITRVDFDVHVADAALRFVLTSSDEEQSIHIEAPYDIPVLHLNCDWMLPGKSSVQFEAAISPGEHSTIVLRDGAPIKIHDNREIPLQILDESSPEGFIPPEQITFSTPILLPVVRSLKEPSYRLLSNSDIKKENSSAALIADVDDPQEDDTGTGSYTYPLTPHLRPGSLDLLQFQVAEDEENLYFKLRFRALSDPGWHPEYGFQLTYAAILVDSDGRAGSGERNVGMNSNVLLHRSEAFERAVFVGGGIRVVSSTGEIIAEYQPRPEDSANPLGDASNGIVTFSLPVDIIGRPAASWKFHVLIGAQDDHGGAGIGEFRSVRKDAGEWHGGGKPKAGDPNVYDELRASIKPVSKGED